MNRFKNKVAVITGAAHGIGKAIADAFEKEGAKVCSIDLNQPCTFQGDLCDPKVLEAFAEYIEKQEGHVDYLIHNAPPLFIGIDECGYDDFMRSLAIGAGAPYYLTRLLRPLFTEGSSIVCVSSTREKMSQPQSESYSAAKGAIGALTHSLAASLGPKTRVNSISPGWIDVQNSTFSTADLAQHPAGRVGRPEDIAAMALFLCSPQAGFITGENITIDGGMSHLMIYHDDQGWSLQTPVSEEQES